MAEWVHDAVFGVSQDRLDAAYRAGSHRGRRTKDGKSYIQLIVPRRRTPHPCSLGGLLHVCFFSAKDPFDPDECTAQVLRSLTVLSVVVLLIQSSLLEWMFHADALLADARLLQRSGRPEEALPIYAHLLQKDPWHTPALAAAHVTHLVRQHPWAASAYLVAVTFQHEKKYEAARDWFRQVVNQAPECALARHGLRTVSHWARGHSEETLAGKGDGGMAESSTGVGTRALSAGGKQSGGDSGEELAWPLQPSVEYVTSAFEGYAHLYDRSMRGLGLRAADMLVSAMSAVLDSQESANGWHGLDLWDLGCGTGAVGHALEAAQRGGAWPAQWPVRNRTCVDASGRMLGLARAHESARKCYDAFVHGEVVEVLQRVGGKAVGDPVRLLLAADVAPYFGALDDLLLAAKQFLGGADSGGGWFALTVEALEPHLPLPAALRDLDQAERRAPGPGDASDYQGRGWELLWSGRVAHLRGYVEQVAVAAGFRVAAIADGPLRSSPPHLTAYSRAACCVFSRLRVQAWRDVSSQMQMSSCALHGTHEPLAHGSGSCLWHGRCIVMFSCMSNSCVCRWEASKAIEGHVFVLRNDP